MFFAGRKNSLSMGRKGSTSTDYLILTAAIAGITIPIVHGLFGEQIIGIFQGNRQTLVDFLAQAPRRGNRPGPSVPQYWFRGERPADEIKDPDALKEPDELVTGELPPPSDISDPSSIQSPRRLRSPRQLRTAQLKAGRTIKEPSQLKEPLPITSTTGGGPGGAAGGAGGAGRGATAGMGGGDGSDSDSSDFFGQDAQSPQSGIQSGSSDSTSGRKAAYGSSVDLGGGGSGSRRSGGSDEITHKKDKDDKRGDSQESGSGGVAEGSRRMSEAMAQAVDRERAKSGAFDWWLIIKVLIIILILFLLILITISAGKR